MEYRALGSTGLQVSAIAFGAGPVASLMTDAAKQEAHRATVERAAHLGINWFDTAATYGTGTSEASLGAALESLGYADRVHVSTKVRLDGEDLDDIAGSVRASVERSLRRLRLERVALLQLHNSITTERGDLHTSLTPHDVLRTGGVLEALTRLKSEGLARHIGLTGFGHADALAKVLSSGAFETVQAPYNILNPSAAANGPLHPGDSDYGNIIGLCKTLRIGVFAIRVLAGGAVAGSPPSQHTLTTRFFPLDVYQRDVARAQETAKQLPSGMSLKEAAIRFALDDSGVSSALIGFSENDQIDEAVDMASRGPLPRDLMRDLFQAKNALNSSI